MHVSVGDATASQRARAKTTSVHPPPVSFVAVGPSFSTKEANAVGLTTS